MKSVYSTVRTLKPTGHVMHQQFNIQKLYVLPTLYLCIFLFISEQTATCITYSINWLVFIAEMKSVYSAVRTLKPTGHVRHQQFNIQKLYVLPTLYLCIFLFISEQTATCINYSINWLVFIAEMKSVYSAVRTLKPTGHVMHQQFNIQQQYALPTLCLCVLYLSENKQRLVPLTA